MARVVTHRLLASRWSADHADESQLRLLAEAVEILSAEDVVTVLRKLEGHALYSIIAVD
jgi:hypothetical protein